MKLKILVILFLSMAGLGISQSIGDYGSVGGSLNWGDLSTWYKWDGTGFNTPAATLPSLTDNVYILDTATVTLDVAVSNCKNLTVKGKLYTSKVISDSLTVAGNVFIDSLGTFKTQTNTVGGNLRHAIALYGNFTNTGTMDFRNGTNGSTLGAMHTYFVGSSNSIVTMSLYNSSNNEFTAMTINKTGGANVICGSDVVISQGNSTNLPAQLIFVSGKIITNQYKFVMLSTSSADLVTPIPDNCWVVGEMGRGMSNSGGKTNMFPVGDMNGYRPLTLHSITGAIASAHYVTVRVIGGNANTGSSILSGGIDKVSKIRYYKVGYNFYTAGAADTMQFDKFNPSYGLDDGVQPANNDLRVAYSINERANWIGLGQTNPHTTNPNTLPTTITPDSVAPNIVLHAGVNYAYISLANVTGGINTLPVELISFTARNAGNKVMLNWSTATENNNNGFEIQRRSASGEWTGISFVRGAGNSSSVKSYSYSDNLSTGGKYSYRLKQIDYDGSYNYSAIAEVDVYSPDQLYLSKNYPNPFNPSTSISFSVPQSGNASLKVFNTLGAQVAELFKGNAVSGKNYDIKFNASDLSSGIYYYTLEFNGTRLTNKMILIK